MVFEKLIDDESKDIYSARIEHMEQNDDVKYLEVVNKYIRDMRCGTSELDVIKKNIASGKKMVLFGAGSDGFCTKLVLDYFNIKISYICDNNKEIIGQKKWGVEVISVNQLEDIISETFVFIATRNYCDDIYKQLLTINYPEEYIIKTKYGKLIGVMGNQYFDMFEPDENEIFIDAGSYDGKNTLDFIKWTEGKYRAVYAFEPFKEAKELIDKNLGCLENVSVVYKATWSENEVLNFGGDNRSSSIGSGEEVIEGVKIDDVAVDGATFIKMDIEGSELNALKGAKNTILKCKPKLAICIYHKPEDIIEIPNYIESLVPEYKFAIRHYTTCMWETVLYAWVD